MAICLAVMYECKDPCFGNSDAGGGGGAGGWGRMVKLKVKYQKWSTGSKKIKFMDRKREKTEVDRESIKNLKKIT